MSGPDEDAARTQAAPPRPGPWRIIRFADCPAMRWKNGGGTTTEIVVSPPGADLARFDWRVSMAEVAQDGPFSAFPGIDRTLAIVAGAGLRLAIGKRPPALCRRDTPPLAFPADVATQAALLEGPVTDLNVMSRRGRASHALRVLALAAGKPVRSAAPVLLLVAKDGPAELDCAGQAIGLAERDALWVVQAGETPVRATAPCRLFAVEIWPL